MSILGPICSLSRVEEISPAFCDYDVGHQLRSHIYERSEVFFRDGDLARDRIQSAAALRRRQKHISESFLRCIGGLPECADSLNARKIETIPMEGFRIEKVIFDSRKNTPVTANLYLPEGIRKPTAAVLFLCGHHETAKAVGEYQIVCQTLVRAGLVVLAQDPIGQGERFSYYDPERKAPSVSWGIWEHEFCGAQCLPLGHSLARYFLHDAMRGVDYLASRPEVDARRIGVTGNSGGGTQTSMMMLADPRIAAAAPCTFIMNRQSYQQCGGPQDAEQIWPGFTAAGLDHEDILLAMCPKPVRVLAVKYDFFPIEGTRRTVERAGRLWKICGAPDRLDLVEDASIHAYTPALARAATEFFSRYLLRSQLSGEKLGVEPIESKRLWCTGSGQVVGEIPLARTVHDENVAHSRALAVRRKKIPEGERREKARRWLRERVMDGRTSCPLNPRFYQKSNEGNLDVEAAYWWSQPGLVNCGVLLRDRAFHGRELPVNLAVWDGGTTDIYRKEVWIRRECAEGRAVLVLDVSGAGHLAPHQLVKFAEPRSFYGVLHKFADDLSWIGDDLSALRVYDVIRALDVIAEWPGLDSKSIRGRGIGKHGIYLQLAAFLDPRLGALEITDGISSWSQFVESKYYDALDIKSVILRGALEWFDLPDLERWDRHETSPLKKRRPGRR